MGEKTVLVKKVGSIITGEGLRNYSCILDMDDVIEKYRHVYANDLENRLGIKKDKFPEALSISTLLNPTFGLLPKIVGSGLITGDQCRQARVDLICKMQDILNTGSTTHIESSSKESIGHSDDESFQDLEDNTNYSKAKRELRELKKYKLKKYQPTFVKPVGGGGG